MKACMILGIISLVGFLCLSDSAILVTDAEAGGIKAGAICFCKKTSAVCGKQCYDTGSSSSEKCDGNTVKDMCVQVDDAEKSCSSGGNNYECGTKWTYNQKSCNGPGSSAGACQYSEVTSGDLC